VDAADTAHKDRDGAFRSLHYKLNWSCSAAALHCSPGSSLLSGQSQKLSLTCGEGEAISREFVGSGGNS
jgi:hypothetical protein